MQVSTCGNFPTPLFPTNMASNSCTYPTNTRLLSHTDDRLPLYELGFYYTVLFSVLRKIKYHSWVFEETSTILD